METMEKLNLAGGMDNNLSGITSVKHLRFKPDK